MLYYILTTILTQSNCTLLMFHQYSETSNQRQIGWIISDRISQ